MREVAADLATMSTREWEWSHFARLGDHEGASLLISLVTQIIMEHVSRPPDMVAKKIAAVLQFQSVEKILAVAHDPCQAEKMIRKIGFSTQRELDPNMAPFTAKDLCEEEAISNLYLGNHDRGQLIKMGEQFLHRFYPILFRQTQKIILEMSDDDLETAILCPGVLIGKLREKVQVPFEPPFYSGPDQLGVQVPEEKRGQGEINQYEEPSEREAHEESAALLGDAHVDVTARPEEETHTVNQETMESENCPEVIALQAWPTQCNPRSIVPTTALPLNGESNTRNFEDMILQSQFLCHNSVIPSPFTHIFQEGSALLLYGKRKKEMITAGETIISNLSTLVPETTGAGVYLDKEVSLGLPVQGRRADPSRDMASTWHITDPIGEMGLHAIGWDMKLPTEKKAHLIMENIGPYLNRILPTQDAVRAHEKLVLMRGNKIVQLMHGPSFVGFLNTLNLSPVTYKYGGTSDGSNVIYQFRIMFKCANPAGWQRSPESILYQFCSSAAFTMQHHRHTFKLIQGPWEVNRQAYDWIDHTPKEEDLQSFAHEIASSHDGALLSFVFYVQTSYVGFVWRRQFPQLISSEMGHFCNTWKYDMAISMRCLERIEIGRVPIVMMLGSFTRDDDIMIKEELMIRAKLQLKSNLDGAKFEVGTHTFRSGMGPTTIKVVLAKEEDANILRGILINVKPSSEHGFMATVGYDIVTTARDTEESRRIFDQRLSQHRQQSTQYTSLDISGIPITANLFTIVPSQSLMEDNPYTNTSTIAQIVMTGSVRVNEVVVQSPVVKVHRGDGAGWKITGRKDSLDELLVYGKRMAESYIPSYLRQAKFPPAKILITQQSIEKVQLEIEARQQMPPPPAQNPHIPAPRSGPPLGMDSLSNAAMEGGDVIPPPPPKTPTLVPHPQVPHQI